MCWRLFVSQRRINFSSFSYFLYPKTHFSSSINKACLTQQNNYINRSCICIILFNEALITCLDKYCTIVFLGDFLHSKWILFKKESSIFCFHEIFYSCIYYTGHIYFEKYINVSFWFDTNRNQSKTRFYRDKCYIKSFSFDRI